MLAGMERISPEQIARYAYEAGFRGDKLTTAVAIALAESGGDVRAHNTDPPDNSYGLWQINMYGDLGPDRRRQHDLDANRDLFNPATNAEVAHEIYEQRGSFQDWSVFKYGQYRKFLDEARKAARAVSADARDNGGGRGPGGTGQGCFAADPELLGTYVRRARGVADGLDSIASGPLRRVRHIADDSFGKVGKESGFAAALDHFTAALNRQVRGVGDNAAGLARSTDRALRAYRDRDEEIAVDLAGIVGGGKD